MRSDSVLSLLMGDNPRVTLWDNATQCQTIKRSTRANTYLHAMREALQTCTYKVKVMPKLKNKKHEAFALELVKGHSAAQAYRNAISINASDEVAYAASSRLLNKFGEIRLRVDEISAQILPTLNRTLTDLSPKGGSDAKIKSAIIDKAWIISMLARNARIAMGDEKIKMMVADKNAETGVKEVEISDRDAAAANKALELLGKTSEIRMFVEQHEHGKAGDFSTMTDAELRQSILSEAEKIGQRDIVDAVRQAIDGPKTIN